MPHWHANEKRFPTNLIGAISPIEVLYDYDWPITFTFECGLGLFLAHLVTVDGKTRHHVCVPIKHDDVAKLKSGEFSIRDVFDRPLLWIIGCDDEGNAVEVYTVAGLECLSATAIPADGVMLYPHLEPLLRIRLLGVQDDDGLIAAELMRSLVVRVQKSVRDLSDIAKSALVFATDAFGPIEDLLALRAQRVAFKSLEIAFREPEREFMEKRAQSDAELEAAYSILRKVQDLLTDGLTWAASRTPTSQRFDDPEIERRWLAAIKQLAPHAAEDEVELSGRLIKRDAAKPVRLVRRDTRKLTRELDRLRKSSAITVEVHGVVDEFDYTMSTFTMRKTDSGVDVRFRYTAALRAKVLAAFDSRDRVIAVGAKKPNQRIVDLVKIA